MAVDGGDDSNAPAEALAVAVARGVSVATTAGDGLVEPQATNRRSPSATTNCLAVAHLLDPDRPYGNRTMRCGLRLSAVRLELLAQGLHLGAESDKLGGDVGCLWWWSGGGSEVPDASPATA